MHKYALIAILCLACINSCKEKDTPLEKKGIPVFSASGLVNGIPLDLNAGVNNYYMSTTFDLLANNIYVFKGNLSPNDCSSCGPSLSVSFRNYTNQFPFSIDSAISIGSHIFFDQRKPIETYYLLHCYPSATGIGTPAISWDFGNNRFSTEYNPIVDFPIEGIYPITCTAVYPGCFSQLQQPVFLTPPRVGKSTDFSVNYTDTHTLLFNSIPVSTGAKVSWDFGDGQTGQGSIIKHTYAISGMYKVCMEYIQGTDTMQLCKNVNTLDVAKCKVNYNFTSKLITDSLHLSQVLVEWKDINGILYSSGTGNQSSTSNFKVLEVSDYQLNEVGQKTRKVKVMFTCSVFNRSNTIELKDITATIAVAYP